MMVALDTSERSLVFRFARRIAGGDRLTEAFGASRYGDDNRARLRTALRNAGVGSRRAYELVSELFTP